MQPIVGGVTKYLWKRVTPDYLSLKNSYTYLGDRWETFMLATDMENGGVVRLKKDNEGQFKLANSWFEGCTMMWSPFPFWIDGQMYVMVCDTGGGDPNVWWEHMHPYWFRVDENFNAGPLVKITLPNPDNIGFIDPSVIQIGQWWYLFVADLWNESDSKWWSPRCFVAETPFGPYKSSRQYQIEVPERGIDEAFKVYMDSNRGLRCTWSSGDSGINGDLYLGGVYSEGMDPEGWHKFRVVPSDCLKAVGSDLCTAGDPGTWPNLYATLRGPGGVPAGRDKFYIAELS